MLRLKSTSYYSLLRESKTKILGKHFIVVYILDEMIKESLAGITVSKKVGNAVVRNKIKRRIKSVLHGYILPDMRKRFYCNIIALSSAVGVEWDIFKCDLEKCLDKLVKLHS